MLKHILHILPLIFLASALQAQLLVPTAENITVATKVGVQNKETSRLEFAYITEKKEINIVIKSPLFMAAKHAKKQAQDYREPDADYLKYLESFKFTRIECANVGFVVDAQFDGRHKVVLLRDGVRVPSVTSVPSFKGKDPFSMVIMNYRMDKAMAAIEQQANAMTKMLLGQMTPEQKVQFIKTQYAAGKSTEEIVKMTGLPKEEIEKSKPAEEVKPETVFGEDDGVFSLEELNKPGKYEAVVRLGNLGFVSPVFGSKDLQREYRIPLKFDNDAKMLKLLKK